VALLRCFLVIAASVLIPGACGGNSDQVPTSPDTAATSELARATGRVADRDGTPVPGAILDVEALQGQPNPAIESIRRTDEAGVYVLELAPGRWMLTIAAEGFRLERVELDLPPAGTVTRDVVLSLE
jgi:hypothetical protein